MADFYTVAMFSHILNMVWHILAYPDITRMNLILTNYNNFI